MIKVMHIGEFKSKFSEVVELLKKGFTIKVVKGRAGEVVGYFSYDTQVNKENRKLGVWSDENFSLSSDFFDMSEDEISDWGI